MTAAPFWKCCEIHTIPIRIQRALWIKKQVTCGQRGYASLSMPTASATSHVCQQFAHFKFSYTPWERGGSSFLRCFFLFKSRVNEHFRYHPSVFSGVVYLSA